MAPFYRTLLRLEDFFSASSVAKEKINTEVTEGLRVLRVEASGPQRGRGEPNSTAKIAARGEYFDCCWFRGPREVRFACGQPPRCSTWCTTGLGGTRGQPIFAHHVEQRKPLARKEPLVFSSLRLKAFGSRLLTVLLPTMAVFGQTDDYLIYFFPSSLAAREASAIAAQ